MKVVVCLSRNRSCGVGSVGGSVLIKSSKSLNPSWVMIAFLQLGKLGPVSLGMLVRKRSSPISTSDWWNVVRVEFVVR